MFRTTLIRCAALALAGSLTVLPALAQEEPADTPAAAAPAAQAPQANWSTRCGAASRAAPLDCAVEQRVVIRETGQQLARLVIRVGAAEPHTPALLVHLPLGLSIRDGVKLAVDGQEVSKLDIQTCDAAGCYAGSPVSEDMLTAMKSGNALKIEFSDLQQKPIGVNFVLAGFTAAYRGIE